MRRLTYKLSAIVLKAILYLLFHLPSGKAMVYRYLRVKIPNIIERLTYTQYYRPSKLNEARIRRLARYDKVLKYKPELSTKDLLRISAFVIHLLGTDDTLRYSTQRKCSKPN